MKLLALFLGCGLWAGGFLAWKQAWNLSSDAALLVEEARQEAPALTSRNGELLAQINELEQRSARILSYTVVQQESTATGAYDKLRERARREGIQLTGAEGLGLIPKPLAQPAAIEALFNAIFDQHPARILDITLDKTTPPAGHARLRLTVLCNTAGMGDIVAALAVNGPWLLTGIKAAAAPQTALAAPDEGQQETMAVELSIFVDLRSWEGASP